MASEHDRVKSSRVGGKISWVELSRKLIGRPYKLGASGDGHALDCMGLLRVFLKMYYEINFPLIYDGYSLDSYENSFRREPIKVMQSLEKWLSNNIGLKDNNWCDPGDILLINLSSKKDNIYEGMAVALYAGNDIVIVSTREFGVTALSHRQYATYAVYEVNERSKIICQQQSQ